MQVVQETGQRSLFFFYLWYDFVPMPFNPPVSNYVYLWYEIVPETVKSSDHWHEIVPEASKTVIF